MSSIAALIVAAGKGQRVGGLLPKQFRPLVGQTVLRRSVSAFTALPEIASFQVVTSEERRKETQAALADIRCAQVVRGGATRQDSVRNGLEALESSAPDFVLIHDAARPLVSERLIRRVIAALEGGARAAIPVLPVSDSLKRNTADSWLSVQRDDLYRAQTPQGFAFQEILAAHREFRATAVTDDMAIAELAQIAITTVTGDEANLKITAEEDFRDAERLLRGIME